ncbi:MAG: flippase-like domain-containing protein [Actinomycetia bacterium]|nr:flippase-like domain-containing protein [Actinomycetes bacterium]
MDELSQTDTPKPSLWKTIALRSLFLIAALVVLYFLWPRLVELMSSAEDLSGIYWYWFVLMAVLMTGAFAAAWELTHIAVPDISRFLAATSQLVSNALAKVIPGGVVAAGATYFQMLSASGVPRPQAAVALAAVSFISNLVLFSLPGVALVVAAISAPIPQDLLPVALAGVALFILMFSAVFVLVKYDKPLLFVGNVIEKVGTWLGSRLKKDWELSATGFLAHRNEVVDALGKRWPKALAAAVANWMLDYMVLFVALYAVGAQPRASLVLVAFAGSAVLGMIPITPGGLGFVEVGLTAMLTASGIPAPDAALATLAYRLFQFWLPIPAGAVAYLVFKRKYGTPADLEGSTA